MDKTPRLRPHERNRFIKDYEAKLGAVVLKPTTYNGWSFNRPPEPLVRPELSLTDGVPIIREDPDATPSL